MQKTKIPWADYTINPVKGLCPMACEYCYARRMYKRFKWNPEIRYELLTPIPPLNKPSKIFVGSTMELFGDWVNDSWLRDIFSCVSMFPEHTFIFLTKQPHNLTKWSPFPDNCWVGVSCATSKQYNDFMLNYADSYQAKVKFISFEPLLENIYTHPVHFVANNINWLIIGSRTQPTRHPKPEWVNEIIEAADTARIPVFVKEPLASFMNIHRQEFPDTLKGIQEQC